MLLHFSEDPSIRVFEPRAAKQKDLTEPVVWAVSPEGAVNFLLPRDCPRITFGVWERTTAEDKARFMGHSTAARVIVAEWAWLARIRACTMYAYEMPPETFEALGLHDGASHFVSRQTVAPISRREITDLLGELAAHDVELRFVRTLWPLRDLVGASSLHFSIYRMGNAQPPIDGYRPRIDDGGRPMADGR
jgi:hypothetical protein